MGHLNDRQIDEILSGKTPLREGSFAEIARHLADARSQLVQALDESTQKAHLAAIVKTARESSGQTWSAPTHHRPSALVRLRVAVMRVGAGAIAASLSTMGLAYAGVDLPGTAAERAFERVGLHLPNQTPEGSGKSVAGDVREVIENTDERNCEFGQAVSETASQNRQSEDKAKEDKCRDRSEKARSKGDAGKARAEDRSDGNAKANEAPRGRKNGKNDPKKNDGKKDKPKKNAGKARGEERRNDKAKANPEPNRGGNAPDRSRPEQSDGSGKGNGGDASSAGKERAEEARARNSASDVVDAVVPDEISDKTKGAGKQK